MIDVGTHFVSVNHDGKKKVLVHVEIMNAVTSLPCPTFGHNFSNVLVGCGCKRFETIILVFVYAQVVEVVEYRATEKVTEAVDEREVDYFVPSNHRHLWFGRIHLVLCNAYERFVPLGP